MTGIKIDQGERLAQKVAACLRPYCKKIVAGAYTRRCKVRARWVYVFCAPRTEQKELPQGLFDALEDMAITEDTRLKTPTDPTGAIGEMLGPYRFTYKPRRGRRVEVGIAVVMSKKSQIDGLAAAQGIGRVEDYAPQ